MKQFKQAKAIRQLNRSLKLKVVMLVLATIFFLTGCSSEDSRVTYFNLRSMDELALENLRQAQENPDIEYWGGFEFGVSALDLVLAPDELWYGVIELADTTEYLSAHVGSGASHDFYLVFKVFINYEEVAFRVRGEEDYAMEFVFLLESGYRVNIPFTLDLGPSVENMTYKLTASVFIVDQNQVINEENHDDFTWGMGMVLNHDLIIGTGSDINFEPEPNATILSREEATNFIDIYVAPELKLNEFGNRARPDLYMQVRRDEDIELYFDTTPQPHHAYQLENYLIIGLLNGQQIPLDGNPFLFVDLGEHEFNHITDIGSSTIEGIDEVGHHDFIMILIPNPAKRNSLANSLPLQFSNRIIIEVIE